MRCPPGGVLEDRASEDNHGCRGAGVGVVSFVVVGVSSVVASVPRCGTPSSSALLLHGRCPHRGRAPALLRRRAGRCLCNASNAPAGLFGPQATHEGNYAVLTFRDLVATRALRGVSYSEDERISLLLPLLLRRSPPTSAALDLHGASPLPRWLGGSSSPWFVRGLLGASGPGIRRGIGMSPSFFTIGLASPARPSASCKQNLHLGGGEEMTSVSQKCPQGPGGRPPRSDGAGQHR